MFVKSIVVMLDKFITVFVVLVTVAVIVPVSTAPNQEPMHKQERATPGMSRRFNGPDYFFPGK